MSHSDTVRQHLMDRQAAEGASSREMARRLMMSEANWCHVRAGRRNLTAAQILRACALYPALLAQVFDLPEKVS
jgi:hypothetical protein